jgi:hypothetical protein
MLQLTRRVAWPQGASSYFVQCPHTDSPHHVIEEMSKFVLKKEWQTKKKKLFHAFPEGRTGVRC